MTDRPTFAFYLNGSKETMWDYAAELKEHGVEMSDEAEDLFKYTGYEVKFDCELDPETGQVYALKVNGTELSEPIKI